ncbi:DUF4145 domain-containing protein [Bacillus haynesii]|uniref:DUF4145 domain-containing protein n=1 Tax=Bacillus haynesii TaxID=1925021 RepID=UPI001594614E|nr:DUF4145 domain-containing protein [Bacillus haynesii]NVB35773.1 DUF4145 domain-containing protein [Bacillus licheniformis]MCY7779109.1 DUF4145 domain-containing protein [Bacillus haynesii]MEC0672183.1 DUF4145 domain-containing protein [Bacillus haynesii]MEC1420137.1 DUF4145 domain-containing protein [Bacillus haynesii]MEC1467526.1 DUF4145 domain-containing protein [Bacillus haynesii]
MSKIEEKVYCRHCKTKTNHQIVINGHGHELKHTLTQLDYDEEIDFQFFEEYAIVQCMGCDTIAFLKKYGDEDMFRLTGPNYHSDREYIEEYTVYPEEPKKESSEVSQLKYYHEHFTFQHLPDLIDGIRREVIFAYENRLELLCNTGIRMIIESICKENGIDKRPKLSKKGQPIFDKQDQPVMVNLKLFEKIEELYKRKIIDEKQKNILLQIKDIGNQTVHEIFRPTLRELLSFLDIIDFILYSIYELPHLNFKNKPSHSK